MGPLVRQYQDHTLKHLRRCWICQIRPRETKSYGKSLIRVHHPMHSARTVFGVVFQVYRLSSLDAAQIQYRRHRLPLAQKAWESVKRNNILNALKVRQLNRCSNYGALLSDDREKQLARSSSDQARFSRHSNDFHLLPCERGLARLQRFMS